MGLKRAIRHGAITAGRLMSRPDLSTRRVVFCYHSVHPDRPYASTKPELFELHVQWLKQHCLLRSLVDLVTDTTLVGDKPVVAITFDDGYEDNHSYALPILARHGVRATFFLTSGLLQRDAAVLGRFQQLWGCAPSDVVPLEWSQVRELHDSGMSIGSHGHTHRNLARLSPAEVESELRTSREEIGDRLGHAIDLFAYPFGKPKVHFTATTKTLVRATGYRAAAAVTFRGVRPSDDPYGIPRFFADGDGIPKLKAKIQGAYEFIGSWQDNVPLWMIRLASPGDDRE